MSEKKYKLLKSLPNLYQAIFEYDAKTSMYKSNCKDGYGEYTFYKEEVFIDNPEWFELVTDTAVQGKMYTQDEVDTIRKETWEAARLHHPIAGMKFTHLDQYLSSLNNSSGENKMFDEEEYSVNQFKSFQEFEKSTEQPSNDNAFAWTDELVKEFINEDGDIDYTWEKEINKFKQSKQPLPPDTDKPVTNNDDVTKYLDYGFNLAMDMAIGHIGNSYIAGHSVVTPVLDNIINSLRKLKK